jgi:hypothetical protein
LYILFDIDHIIPSRADEIVVIEDIVVLVLKSSDLDDLALLFVSGFIILGKASIIATKHDLTINHIVLGLPSSLLLLLLLKISIIDDGWKVFAADVLCCIAAL